MDDRIKTLNVQRYGIKLGDEARFSAVREATEKLAEAILSSMYPMIPNKTYDHVWSGTGLMSSINSPTVIRYIEPMESP